MTPAEKLAAIRGLVGWVKPLTDWDGRYSIDVPGVDLGGDGLLTGCITGYHQTLGDALDDWWARNVAPFEATATSRPAGRFLTISTYRAVDLDVPTRPWRWDPEARLWWSPKAAHGVAFLVLPARPAE